MQDAPQSVQPQSSTCSERIANWWRRWVYLGLLLQVIALLGRHYFWWADLLSHFALFALIVVLITFALEGFRRHWVHLAVLASGALILGFFVASYGNRAAIDASAPADLRVMSFNVLTHNPAKDEVLTEIQRLNPDVLVMIEVNSEWIQALNSLHTVYPYRIERPSADNFGIACYSRYPLEPAGDNRLLGLSVIDSYILYAEHKKIRLIGVHTLPPINRMYWELTRNMAAGIVERLNPNEATVVCGDFNATPTSAIWQDLIRGGALLPAGRDRALNTTWGLYGIGSLQLDHVFIAGPVQVTEDTLGRFSGSDHKPVLTGLRFE